MGPGVKEEPAASRLHEGQAATHRGKDQIPPHPQKQVVVRSGVKVNESSQSKVMIIPTVHLNAEPK